MAKGSVFARTVVFWSAAAAAGAAGALPGAAFAAGGAPTEAPAGALAPEAAAALSALAEVSIKSPGMLSRFRMASLNSMHSMRLRLDTASTSCAILAGRGASFIKLGSGMGTAPPTAAPSAARAACTAALVPSAATCACRGDEAAAPAPARRTKPVCRLRRSNTELAPLIILLAHVQVTTRDSERKKNGGPGHGRRSPPAAGTGTGHWHWQLQSFSGTFAIASKKLSQRLC